jgi:hypothetical protein
VNPTERLSSTKFLELSLEFTTSARFLPTTAMSWTVNIAQSLKVSFTKNEFSITEAFGSTKGYSSTQKYSSSIQQSASNFLTVSSELGSTVFITVTEQRSETRKFTETEVFSQSKDLTLSDSITHKNEPTVSMDLSRTGKFSVTNRYSFTGRFWSSNEAAFTVGFSLRNDVQSPVEPTSGELLRSISELPLGTAMSNTSRELSKTLRFSSADGFSTAILGSLSRRPDQTERSSDETPLTHTLSGAVSHPKSSSEASALLSPSIPGEQPGVVAQDKDKGFLWYIFATVVGMVVFGGIFTRMMILESHKMSRMEEEMESNE